MDKYILNILSNTQIFKNLTNDEIEMSVKLLNGRFKDYNKGEAIINLFDKLTSFGIIISGSITGSYMNQGYDELNMAKFKAGDIFGETIYILSIEESPVSVIANEKTTVLWLQFVTDKESYLLQKIYLNYIKSIAEKNLFLNNKLRIYSEKKLRDRIKLFILQRLHQNDYIILPFNKTELAKLLGVNRSALERELSRMINENIIKIEKKKIMIIDKKYFNI